MRAVHIFKDNECIPLTQEVTETSRGDEETRVRDTETPKKETETPQKETETPQKETETPQKETETARGETETARRETSKLVVKNVYEGGHAEWECSRDLCDLLTELSGDVQWTDVIHKRDELRVLELGCGIGLPSLRICELREARGLKTCVVLQDMNIDVLLKSTSPTFLAKETAKETAMETAKETAQETATSTRVFLIASDWDALTTNESAEFIQQPFDLILSAETTYREENFPSLLRALARFSATHTRTLMAQKRFYFGLGGGSLPFRHFVSQSRQAWTVTTLKEYVDGMSNVRDIIYMTKQQ